MAPKYQRVAEMIRADCLRRNLPMDAYLPTEVDLAASFKVNRLTVRRALKHLENQRIVSPVTGKRRRLLAATGLTPRDFIAATRACAMSLTCAAATGANASSMP